MATAPQHRLTAQEYLEIERLAPVKSEFNDGQLYAMAGASFAHVGIVGNLLVSLRSALRNRPCRSLMSDLRVEVERRGSLYVS